MKHKHMTIYKLKRWTIKNQHIAYTINNGDPNGSFFNCQRPQIPSVEPEKMTGSSFILQLVYCAQIIHGRNSRRGTHQWQNWLWLVLKQRNTNWLCKHWNQTTTVWPVNPSWSCRDPSFIRLRLRLLNLSLEYCRDAFLQSVPVFIIATNSS